MSAPSTPCVLVVADPGRVRELVAALSEPLERGPIEVIESSGGDDTIDLFEERHPAVVVLTAGLELGDAKSLIETLRGMAPRAEVGIVLIGDDTGPIRTALDALELAPDRFLTRPLAPTALRFAVTSCLDAVDLARGGGGDLPRPRTKTDRGTGMQPTTPAINGVSASGTPPNGTPPNGTPPPTPVDDGPTSSTRAALRARWEALADSIGSEEADEEPAAADPPPAAQTSEEPAPLPPPLVIRPRRRTNTGLRETWQPGTTSELREEVPIAPAREPTLILHDEPPGEPPPLPPERPSQPPAGVTVTERGSDEPWSEPVPLAELMDHDRRRDSRDDVRLPDVHVVDVHELGPPAIDELGPSTRASTPPPIAPAPAGSSPSGGHDFARQLRQKMSMMAQRLFQASPDSGATPAVDVAPRHDHHTEIDLAALGEEPALGAGVTEIESRAARVLEARHDAPTSPGSWETQVRERGLPESGDLVRGLSDAPMLLARMFAQSTTGRVAFHRGDIEKIVFFDQGRPVFAASNEPGDRMGELLVREGKITAAQYERCQSHALSSGRRMGEILVDFGYLKRRELLPAVRRHVEDLVYSLFGWDRGQYRVHVDPAPTTERIRLSRHPAALILEGIRRKLDRSALERLVGPASTVIEVPDRERLGGIVNASDLVGEERAALAAFDGHADLAQVARVAGVDLADLLPLAWGLCVLGLATARRAESEAPEEGSALVGETDLEIDRERVRARWRLVSEADYFALLGVRRDATAFEIRRAYQAARRDFSADCFPNDLRRELAQELDEIATVLDEAFRVLRDDRLRLTYLENLIE